MSNVVEERMTDSPSSTGFESTNDPEDSTDEVELEDLARPTRGDGEELEIGDVFELLKNKRRRRVIEFLKKQDDRTTTLDVLAEHIAALENDVDVSQLSSSQRKRVYIGLYQCHLPKMDDFGVIEYQKNRGIIELQDTSQIDRYLVDDTADPRDGRMELTFAVAVAGVVGVGLTGVGPFAVVPTIAWTVFSVTALVALALYQLGRLSD